MPARLNVNEIGKVRLGGIYMPLAPRDELNVLMFYHTYFHKHPKVKTIN